MRKSRHEGATENFTVRLTLEQWPETNVWLPQHMQEKKRGKETQMKGTAWVKTRRCDPVQRFPGTASSWIILDCIRIL